MTVPFEDARLVMPERSGGGTSVHWKAVSLIGNRDVETNTAVQALRQMDTPPIVHDESRLTIRPVDVD